MLEEVGREGGEKLQAGELLGHEGPEGDEGAEAVDAFEDGVPFLGALGGGKVGFMLDRNGEQVDLLVDIVVLHAFVEA